MDNIQLQLKVDHSLISDYWQLFKQCSEADWETRYNIGTQFAIDHGESRFAKDLVLALMDELERREQKK